MERVGFDLHRTSDIIFWQSQTVFFYILTLSIFQRFFSFSCQISKNYLSDRFSIEHNIYISRLSKSKTLCLDFLLWNWWGGRRIFLKIMHCSGKRNLSVKTSTYSQPYKCFMIIVRNQSELVIFFKFPRKKRLPAHWIILAAFLPFELTGG